MAINREVFISFYAILICLGVPGNVLILAGYSRKKVKNGTDIFIMGLAAVDLFSSFLTIAKFRPWVRSNSFCQFQFFFTGWIAMAQMAVTLAISVDRYFAVCRPIHRRPRVKTAIAVIILCIIGTALLYSPVLAAVRYEPTIKDCIYRQDLQWFLSYDRYVVQSYVVLTLILVTAVYTRIVFALRRQTKVRTALTASEPSHTKTDMEATATMPSITGNNTGQGTSGSGLSTSTDPKQAGSSDTLERNTSDGDNGGELLTISNTKTNVRNEGVIPANQTKITAVRSYPLGERVSVVNPGAATATATAVDTTALGRQGENRLTLMLGWVTVFYVVSWLPAIIGRYLPVEVRRDFMSRSDLHHTLYAIFFRFYEINSAINFFIYWPLNKRFRQNCKDIFIQIKNYNS
nr:adenosine receptor A2b-like [Lytechinus pictus]